MKHPTIVELARKVRDEWIRERIQDVLAISEGSVCGAARLSGMDVANFRRLMRRVEYPQRETWAQVEERYRGAFAALPGGRGKGQAKR